MALGSEVGGPFGKWVARLLNLPPVPAEGPPMKTERKITKKELAPCPQRLARLLARAEAMLAGHSLRLSSISPSRHRHFPLRTPLLTQRLCPILLCPVFTRQVSSCVTSSCLVAFVLPIFLGCFFSKLSKIICG